MLREIYSAGIIGIGSNMPEQIRKNDFWDEYPILNLPNKDKDPFKGTVERRVFPENIAPSDAETEAGRRAIEDAGLNKDDIDLVMVHSMLQDEIIPGNASLVQYKLGLKNAGAWNMDTCCSSFVTMFIAASNLIAMGTFNNILIITSVFHSHMLDYAHYITPSLGDGSAAVVVGRVAEGRGYKVSHCTSHGQYHDGFTMKERIPMHEKWVHYKPSPAKPVLVFNNEITYKIGKNSVKDMTEVITDTLNKGELTPQDIDFMVTHQPVYWAHDAWREALGIDASKSYQSFKQYGNLASSTIPVNLYEAREKGLLKDDDMILFASSGAGENFSVALLKWGK